MNEQANEWMDEYVLNTFCIPATIWLSGDTMMQEKDPQEFVGGGRIIYMKMNN